MERLELAKMIDLRVPVDIKHMEYARFCGKINKVAKKCFPHDVWDHSRWLQEILDIDPLNKSGASVAWHKEDIVGFLVCRLIGLQEEQKIVCNIKRIGSIMPTVGTQLLEDLFKAGKTFSRKFEVRARVHNHNYLAYKFFERKGFSLESGEGCYLATRTFND